MLDEALEILTATWSGAPSRPGHYTATRGGRQGQDHASSQASGDGAACVSETPPSAAQDARGAEGHGR
jgi:hypothetical protein